MLRRPIARLSSPRHHLERVDRILQAEATEAIRAAWPEPIEEIKIADAEPQVAHAREAVVASHVIASHASLRFKAM